MLFGDASVVANKFNLISFWIMKVERPPLDSIVLLRFDSQSDRLQPLAFGFVVGQSKAKPITPRARSPAPPPLPPTLPVSC